MNNQSETIRKFVTYINNQDYLGGFWLPNIQRPFVWSEDQITKVYDSILREYPIGSMLIWKNDENIKFRKFIDNWHENLRITDFYDPKNNRPKMLVLDGQQRIQSLYIGLRGSYNGKELYFNILSGDWKDPEDIRYEFRFIDDGAVFPWIKLKSLIFTDKKKNEIYKEIFTQHSLEKEDFQEERIKDNIDQIREVFCVQENILYQVIDSIDKKETYKINDVVEIFIRANSGGTFLNKSDLMFSLLVSSWEDVEDSMSDLIMSLNATGYKFSRDFILKVFLVLLDQGARYSIEKFRTENIKDKIKSEWDDVVLAIKVVKDFIYGDTYLKTDKTIPSYLSLIPLIYFRYKYKGNWNKHLQDYQKYLLRVSLTGVFGGTPDNMIDNIVKSINENKDFSLDDIFSVIRKDNRNLELSQETILGFNYWKKEIHLFLNLWYGFNYQPSYSGNKPQIDHIFPQSVLKSIKKVNPETGKKDLMVYNWEKRDQIGNLMLLTATENGATDKTDIVPEIFFVDKSVDYLNLHLIPHDKTLWKIENFDKFIEERNLLILKKFDYLIQKK